MCRGADLTLWGLELGLLTMKRGEHSRVLLQPQYAYGDLGCPPLIPAAAVVLYEVQIVDYFDSGQVEEFFAMSPVSMCGGVGGVMNNTSVSMCYFS